MTVTTLAVATIVVLCVYAVLVCVDVARDARERGRL